MLLALALALASGCGQSRGRVLLIGVDGASLRVISPLFEQNRLPNLRRIARQGVYGRLRAHFPIESPRIWTSIATGKRPAKHGIETFVRPQPDGTKRLLLSTDRKVHALWNIASDAGLTVGVVNWWNTYPPEKIRGVMLTDHVLPGVIEERRRLTGAVQKEQRAPLMWPTHWMDRAKDLLRPGNPPVPQTDPFEGNDALPRWVRRDFLSRRFREDGLLVKLTLAIEKQIHPELLMLFLPGIDRVSHFLWGSLEPPELYPARLRFSPDQREAAADALYAYYDYTDALIGVLLKRYRSSDLVMVVSDHGFEAGRKLGWLTGVHDSAKALHGIFFARGSGIPASGLLGAALSANDVTPTVLAWLGMSVAEDMDGRPAPFLDVKLEPKIPSYDTTPIERLAPGPSGVETEMLEQLRELGYVE